MKDPSPRAIGALLALTCVTGIIDAVSVLGLSHVFVANMTGNVVFIGFGLLGEGKISLLDAALAIPCFMLGAVAGGKLGRTAERVRLRAGFALDSLLLLAAAAAAFLALSNHAIIALLAVAMGLRTALVRSLGIADLPTTVLTLTLAGIGADSSWAGGKNPNLPRRLGGVAAMLLGAVLGALLHSRAPACAILIAAVAEGLASFALVSSLPAPQESH